MSDTPITDFHTEREGGRLIVPAEEMAKLEQMADALAKVILAGDGNAGWRTMKRRVLTQFENMKGTK